MSKSSLSLKFRYTGEYIYLYIYIYIYGRCLGLIHTALEVQFDYSLTN